MFSAKHVIVALTLAFLAINAVECGSQCHNWLANGGKSSAPKQVIAKMIPAHQEKHLQRRITPTKPAKTIAGGDHSTCGAGYNPKYKPGACLWNGISQASGVTLKSGAYPGWLNGNYKETKNCGRQIYINAPNQKTYWTTVLDGCKFGDYLPEADGCSMIWLTEKTFRDLGGNPDDGYMKINNWDFDPKTGSD
ncbi:hypothetical protein PCANC_25789 [Puccinia coronata f. sp. avenae]|uniref:Secreted protein n=1 Tax=Puccinia coronata f. sp. avenae TaxID=200324 RepID=A0A2N5U4F2_9BASI|nr:hypothetical protein PCANC_28574 [Puccinia coronata f. sp. avenae]PLW32635.1 hypothetical protein PCANC_25789 [Puccinia coronata f. sp. avenae]